MQFDDRLATVLRSAAPSDAAMRTQFRQLLDLLGSSRHGVASDSAEAAYERLAELAGELPSSVQSAILRAPGLRLRNRALVAWLAAGEPQAAAAAMATAQLSESDWLYLIPRLPITARGFLRHRQGLPFSARQVLDRLGVGDLVLPEPEAVPATPALAPAVPRSEPRPHADAEAGIGALVRRIEAFQRARREGAGAARLPIEDTHQLEREAYRGGRAFDFAADARGLVTWADPAVAPLTVGLTLGPPRPGAVAQIDEGGARSLARRVPLRGASVVLAGPPEIAGEWRIDAAPVFAPETGQFAGYHGRLRRPGLSPAGALRAQSTGAGDRLRQVLHELRTPVNAIQGFAELIQQQMFGAAPNEYRALAAAVAVDAARLMAGFDEIERLARLETGAQDLTEGRSDWREVVGQILRRLDGALRPRSAKIDLFVEGSPFTVGVEHAEAMQLAWRLLATMAGALAPGEIIDLTLRSDGARVTMETDLPGSMLGHGDLFAASAPAQPRAISAGMFGSGFTLRLARAEAEAVGGTLERDEDCLRLVLPALTGHTGDHTLDRGANGGISAA